MKKIVIALLAFSAISAGFIVALHPSPAAQARYSSQQIFDASMGGYVATFASQDAKTVAPTVTEVEHLISARDSGFFEQFGSEMTSGNPGQVSRAISAAASQVRTIMRTSNAVSATKHDVASTLVVVFDIDNADVEDNAIVTAAIVGEAVADASDYRSESLAANLARRFADRLAPAAD